MEVAVKVLEGVNNGSEDGTLPWAGLGGEYGGDEVD